MSFALSVRSWLRSFAAIALIFTIAGPAAAAPTGTFRYAIHDNEFGEVGTYTNVIQRKGALTVVRNRVDVAFRALFMVVYRFSADRTETWRGDRLVGFKGKANDDGTVIKVSGQANGDHFLIDGPRGTTAAPAHIVPTNPWAMRLTQASVNMTTTTGEVVPVQIAELANRTITVGGRSVRTRYIRLKTGAEMWYDRAGVLVRFTYAKNGRTLHFVLRQDSGRSTAHLPGTGDDTDSN